MKIRLRGKQAEGPEAIRPVAGSPEPAGAMSQPVSQRRGFLKLVATAAGLAGVAGLGQVAAPARRAEAADETVSGNLYVTGSVGVGTTSPGAILDIGGPGSFRMSGNATLSGYGGVEFANASGFGLKAASLNYAFNGSNGTTTLMTINSSGNVGIGTTNPGVKLDIGTIGDTSNAFRINRNSIAGGHAYLDLGGYSYHHWLFDADGGTDNLYLATGAVNQNVNSYVMTLGATGNIGIGTTQPAEKLDVVGNIRLSGVVSVNGTVAIDSNGVAQKSFYAA